MNVRSVYNLLMNLRYFKWAVPNKKEDLSMKKKPISRLWKQQCKTSRDSSRNSGSNDCQSRDRRNNCCTSRG